MLLIFFILLISLSKSLSKIECNLSNGIEEKIKSSDLIIVGRIQSLAGNELVVSVTRILKGFELINEVKKISHNNDYHLIVVRNIQFIIDCKIQVKSGDDFLFYLKKTEEQNFFDLKFATEYGDGLLEKQTKMFLSGSSSKLVKNSDPCSKLDCKFGAQCHKWPGNPPSAVCLCASKSCPLRSKENQICGSDGKIYDSDCHLKREECITQKAIKSSSSQICEKSLVVNDNIKTEVQQDDISGSNSQFCQYQTCPPYAACVSHPYPHCKCPSDTCGPSNPPVCGTDDITYTNICELKKVSCKANRFIGQQNVGRCDICKFIKCEFNGICEMNPDGIGFKCQCPDPAEVCSTKAEVAVCSSNDVTYKSECLMKIESCQKNIVLTVIHKGECRPKKQDDVCVNHQCHHGSKCTIQYKNNVYLPFCSCDHKDCNKNWQNPVCGDDGQTYINQCFLEKSVCEKQRTINIVFKGKCEQNPCHGVKCFGPHQYCRVDNNGKSQCVCPESCPEVVQPVCGNDNKTYDSVCHLTRTACTSHNPLWIIHNGVCTEEPRCQEQGYDCSAFQICRSDIKQTRCECPTCPDLGIGEYVCGTDGKTYRSECHLRKNACGISSVSLKIANFGACDACQTKNCSFYSICRMNRFGDPQCICPTDCVYIRRPVCGSDDRTYENDCFLKVKSCAENRPISVINEGTCKKCHESCSLGQMCRAGKCVCSDKCPKQKLRVCGSDGSYYDNECELKRQACIQKKTIRIDESEAGCISRQYISDETGSNSIKNSNRISWSKQSCYCNKIGSLNNECDLINSQCNCKNGVTGKYCDKCIFGYWKFSEYGCTACSCNKFGSQSMQCDNKTGNCLCKPRVLGKYCSVCPTGFSMSNNGCKETFYNENKIDAVELGFVKDSYAKSFWSGNAENYLSINISFVPYSSDGIIFYHFDPDKSNDFLTLILKNRFIEYRIDLGSDVLLLKSNIQLSLGKMHSVLIERFERYTRLIIDDNDFQNGVTPSFLKTLDAGINFVIGQALGLKKNVLSHTNGITESFVGCLSSLKITSAEETNDYLMNQQASWITESSNVKPNCPHIDFKQSMNVVEEFEKEENFEKENLIIKDYCELHKPCLNGGFCKSVSEGTYNCQCSPGYQGYTCEEMVSPIWKFKDIAFAVFPSESLQLRQRLKLEISFLPTSSNGLLSFISDGHDPNPAFISVILNKNHIEVTCRTPIGITHLISAETIFISKWNHVVVLKAAKYIYLNLNQSPHPIKKRLIPRGFMNVDAYVRRKLTQFRITNQPLFFGGVDNNIFNSFSSVVYLKPNFQGAIQKIVVNQENIRFQNPDIIFHNVTQWQGAPCGPLHNRCSKTDPEKSFCIAEMNKSICFCNPKQEHLCMRNSMQHDNPSNTNFNRRFLGESAAKFTTVKQKREKSTKKNNIRLKFKTSQADGMLVLLKKMYSTKKHFLVMAIRNSVIEVAINMGGKDGIIRITGKRRVSDNVWHTVQVIRNNRNVVLLIDNRMFRARMLNDITQSSLETDGWMWLGGPKKSVEGFPWEYNTYFKGCIAELYVDEISYNLINDARKNIGPVLKC